MKIAKRVLVLLVALALCLSLGGCNALDSMRANHAVWQPDGSIFWGEHRFKPVPSCPELCPYFSYDYDEPSVYVTDPDVPVLLSVFMGECMDISDDGMFLEGEYLTAHDGGGEDYPLYCREDKYEEVVNRIESGYTPELYFYYYSVYDKETYEFREECYDLTAEQVEAVQYVYSTVIPQKTEPGFYFESDESLFLYAASKDRLFMREFVCLEAAGQVFYLTLEQADGTRLLYAVPSDLRPVFDSIFTAQRKAEEDMYEDMYEEDWDEEWV